MKPFFGKVRIGAAVFLGAIALAILTFVSRKMPSAQAMSQLSGTVQGGLSPVSGAAVTLYAAGTAYGSNATSLGSTTTNASGDFTVGFTSPATPIVLYLVVLGGNAGSGSNTAIGLMGVLGMSNALPASVTINEITTAAAESGLAQFTDSTGQIIGGPTSNATGLANQVQGYLADISTGTPAIPSTVPLNCSGGSQPVNCDGLERLDTISNILAACVESSGPSSSACSTLLSNTGSSTTTLQAAHVMATNPVANVGTLFALQGGSPPFTPDLSAAPDGWEIALNFDPANVFNGPNFAAIDGAGNVWVPNLDGNSVTELTPTGGLMGNFAPSGANFDSPEYVAIDASGNAWVPNIASVTVLTSSGGLFGNFNNSNTSGANFNNPISVAIDADGNAWVPNLSGNSVTVLTSSGGLVGNFSNSNTGGANFNQPGDVAIDAASNAWVPNVGGNSVTELTSSGDLVGNLTPGGAQFDQPGDVAIDAVGNVWVTDDVASLSELPASCTTSSCIARTFNNSNTSGANFNEPEGIAIDGAGNVWTSNAGGNSVTELTSSGGLIGNFAPIGANFNSPEGVPIDASGNVWVPNFGGNSLAELIGVARPVLTPLVACLNQTPPHAVCLPGGSAPTATATATSTATATATPTATSTPTATATATTTSTATATATVTSTATATQTATSTATGSATPTGTSTATATPTATPTPNVITVNSSTDPASTSGNGFCTLREALNNANAKSDTSGGDCAAGTGNDTIRFSICGTITLVQGTLPAIANSLPGSLTIDGSGQTITVNGANLYGVLVVNSGATLSLISLTIVNGNAGYGGGVSNSGTLTVANSKFSGNASSNSISNVGAGGINNVTTSSTLTVSNSTFSGNNGLWGGAIENYGQADITDSTFNSNTAANGGGAINNDGTLTIANSTFLGNTVTGDDPNFFGGGAVRHSELSNTLTVTNCTFSGNTAPSGGGGAIDNYVGHPFTITNSILANSPSGGDCTGTTTNGGYNIADDATCVFGSSTAVNGDTIGDNVTDANLNLDTTDGLANNGGPTETIALDSPSFAIEAIPIGDCPATDQRRAPRPALDSACDIGAFEFGGVVPATPTPTACAASTPTATATATATSTSTPTATGTASGSATPTATATPSPTLTATPTSTDSATRTPTATVTATRTATSTATPTTTATASATPTLSATATATRTATPTPTATSIGPLNFSPKSITFKSQKFGTTSKPKMLELSNPKSNNGEVVINGISFGTSEFAVAAGSSTCGSSIRVGRKCKIGVVFKPEANGPQPDTLTISDNASNSPQQVTLSGIGKDAPLATPTATTTSTLTATPTATATATGGTPTVTATATRTATATATLTATATATSTGAATPTATITATVTRTPKPKRTPTPTPSPTPVPEDLIYPSSVNFGEVTVGHDKSMTFTLTNSAQSGPPISFVTPAFSVPPTHPQVFGFRTGATNCRKQLSPQKACQLTVQFIPAMQGPVSAMLTVSDDAANANQMIMLSGSGK
jgi:predicted outer membrane repeat protein